MLHTQARGVERRRAEDKQSFPNLERVGICYSERQFPCLCLLRRLKWCLDYSLWLLTQTADRC